MKSSWIWALTLGAVAWGEPAWKVNSPLLPLVAPPGTHHQLEIEGPSGNRPRATCGPHQVPLEEVRPGVYQGRFPATSGPLKVDDEVLGECLAQPCDEVFQVGAAGAVFRTGPSSDYDRLTPLPPGVRLQVLQRQGDYLQVAPPLGWVRRSEGDLLPPETSLGQPLLQSVQVGASQLRLRLGTACAWQVSLSPERRTLVLDLPGVAMAMGQMSHAANAHRIASVQLQPYSGGTRLEVVLNQRLWGYRLAWTGQDLLLQLSPAPTIQPRRPLQGLTVALDPGHGGEDKGTVGLGRGVMEKELNLRCSLALAEELRAAGARVVLTRDSDRQVVGDEASAAEELEGRVRKAEQAGAHLFLSIHHNARPDVKDGRVSHGTHIYYYQPQSGPLARALAAPLARSMGEPSWMHLWRSFHVIRQTSMPSVLLEYNFLSNPTLEAGMLARPDYPRRTARAVRRGLEDFLLQRL